MKKQHLAYSIPICLLPTYCWAAQTADSLSLGRQFSQQALENYRDDPAFVYEVASEGTHWLAQLWLMFLGWLKWIVFSPTDGVSFWGVSFYIAIIVILLFIVFRLLGIDAGHMLGRSLKLRAKAQVAADEDIHSLDFEQAFAQAEKEQDYSRLIRLYYLAALKLLTDRGLIRWQPGKTNHQYLQELVQPSQRSLLSDLGYYFEYAWYGNFPVNVQQAAKAKFDYQALQQEVV